MEKSKLTAAHFAELLKIDASSGGIGREVEELIARLKTAGDSQSRPGAAAETARPVTSYEQPAASVCAAPLAAPAAQPQPLVRQPFVLDTDPLRAQQAKVLFDLGAGRVLGYNSFLSYLKSIPPVPQWPAEASADFNRTILVDTRVDLSIYYEILGVDVSKFETQMDDDFRDDIVSSVYWIRCQDGRRFLNRSVQSMPDQPHSTGLTVTEALCLLVQDAVVIKNHNLILPGTSMPKPQNFRPCLGEVKGRTTLTWVSCDSSGPNHGVATRYLGENSRSRPARDTTGS